MNKIAIFAFQGEPMCFFHALLNALDLKAKNYDIKLIIEGSATKLVKELNSKNSLFHEYYIKCIEEGIIDCVCQACAQKMGTLDDARKQELPLCSEMSGHPSMSSYIKNGYTVVTL